MTSASRAMVKIFPRFLWHSLQADWAGRMYTVLTYLGHQNLHRNAFSGRGSCSCHCRCHLGSQRGCQELHVHLRLYFALASSCFVKSKYLFSLFALDSQGGVVLGALPVLLRTLAPECPLTTRGRTVPGSAEGAEQRLCVSSRHPVLPPEGDRILPSALALGSETRFGHSGFVSCPRPRSM